MSAHSRRFARKPRPSSLPTVPDPPAIVPEALHDLDRLVVERHEPPLGDQAVDQGRLALIGESDDRHMQIVAVIHESRFRLFGLEILRAARFEIEDIDEVRDVLVGRLLEVDPEKRRAPDLGERLRPVVHLVDAIAVEEERRRHATVIPRLLVR